MGLSLIYLPQSPQSLQRRMVSLDARVAGPRLDTACPVSKTNGELILQRSLFMSSQRFECTELTVGISLIISANKVCFMGGTLYGCCFHSRRVTSVQGLALFRTSRLYGSRGVITMFVEETVGRKCVDKYFFKDTGIRNDVFSTE